MTEAFYFALLFSPYYLSSSLFLICVYPYLSAAEFCCFTPIFLSQKISGKAFPLFAAPRHYIITTKVFSKVGENAPLKFKTGKFV